MTLAITPKTKDILSYESEVWTSADILRSSVGLKASDFPDFMMPFFALRLVESRLIRKYAEICQDTSLTTEEDRIEEIKDSVGFYNSMVIEKKITLIDIIQNDKTFYQDFRDYLNSFDQDLQSLLGIINSDKTENLDIDSKIDSLRKKNVLFGYTSAWAKIDFTPYDNGEVTTLEEHIKRKWADMSAETAGEQYTPYDIFNLIAELITTKNPKQGKINSVYDMTCGGANMLFGIEDRLKSINSNIKTETYGQELRGSLYALAKIEAMFRKGAFIEQGNTLTEDKFPHKTFDFGVANPPYGVSWKEEQKTIENDQTGRFGHGGYPSVSDGQLLFVQHMLSKLNETGVAFIVLNGSPLFSGDAGSGESNIRKWILENDWLEALIQLPTNEFFNTGITTYIWCLNKNKSLDRKDKVLCINAEEQCVKLKKNKGNKSKEISKEQAKNIADIYRGFYNSDISKIKSKYDFYFNKQSLRKLEKDEQFGALNKTIKFPIFNIIISDEPKKILNEVSMNIKIYSRKEIDKNLLDSLKEKDWSEYDISFKNEASGKAYQLNENNCIEEIQEDGDIINLGYGKIVIKEIKKKNIIDWEIQVEPVWTKDDEKIEYSPTEQENQSKIDAFMKKWVSKDSSDYQLLGNQVGVEINFNSVFPKKIEIRSTADILADIANIDKELGDI